MKQQFDIIVIGSGLAGLSFCLRTGNKYKIALITKDEPKESSTLYAQGGIASVALKEDSFMSHIQDTMIAGDNLGEKDVVEQVIKDGPNLITDLLSWGVRFTYRDLKNHRFLDLLRNNRMLSKSFNYDFTFKRIPKRLKRFIRDSKKDKNKKLYDLAREGGHSKRRIYHKEDSTGKELEDTLYRKVSKMKNISIFKNTLALNLITSKRAGKTICNGVYALDKKNGKIDAFVAPVTILSTGGAGKVYMYTSNPDIATGDGVAMAYRAGAEICNMEFIQFHPTCLYHKDERSFLISEALRGEGAELKLENGKEFMYKYHPLGSLAPRDIVARAIDIEMKKRGVEFVCLDISHKSSSFIKKRFPNIYEVCLSLGIDITKEPIPVVPAAHYICGGVRTDIHGKTNIKNLYAIGEVASTGFHGANRLASNSLLEALYFAKTSSNYILDNFPKQKVSNVKSWNTGQAIDSNEQIMIKHNWQEIRRFMWNYVGIVRSDKRLERAKRRIDLLKKEVEDYYWNFTITAELIELRNLVTVADIIIKSAKARKESRGLHYSLDYPEKKEKFRKETIITQ